LISVFKHIKDTYKNLYTGGISEEYTVETVRKMIAVNFICIFGSLLMAFFGLIDYFQGDRTLGLVLIITCFLLLAELMSHRKTGNNMFASYFCTTLLGGLFVYLFITGAISNTGFLWSLTFPLIIMFLFGVNRGSVITGIFFSILLFLMIFGNKIFPGINYTGKFNLRFPGTFLSVWVIA